jgi:hypothetical protein
MRPDGGQKALICRVRRSSPCRESVAPGYMPRSRMPVALEADIQSINGRARGRRLDLLPGCLSTESLQTREGSVAL